VRKEVIIKYCEKGIVGAIDQGFTCLATQTVQSLHLEGIEDYPTMTRLINDKKNNKPQYINKRVHQTFP
jgi:hypothetical protein